MSYYTGEKCLICNKEFTESDDIVVCPDCGTPYHRSCYKEKKQCINSALHKTGGSWMAESKAKRKAENAVKKICPQCSVLNDNSNENCINCGYKIEDDSCKKINIDDSNVIKIDSDNEYYGMNPFETMDEESKVTFGEVADYVKVNKLFYLSVFRRIKATGINLSLNVIAFLFPQYYFANRKMYFWTGILLLVGFIIEIPSFIVLMSDFDKDMGMGMISAYFENHPISPKILNLFYCFEIIIKVIFGLLANDLYLKHIILKLKKIKGSSPDYARYRMKIKEQGGTSLSAIVITGVIKVLMVSGLYLVLSVIAYYG